MIHVFQIKVLCAGLTLGLLLLTASPAKSCREPHAAAPHGQLIREPLTACDEMQLLRPGREPSLYAVAAPDGSYRAGRRAALLVHGLDGHPADLSELAERLSQANYQVYVLFFDDMGRRVRDNGGGAGPGNRRAFSQAGVGTRSHGHRSQRRWARRPPRAEPALKQRSARALCRGAVLRNRHSMARLLRPFGSDAARKAAHGRRASVSARRN